MSRAFSGMVSRCCLFSHCITSIAEYKTWSISWLDRQFLFFGLLMMSGMWTQKNRRMKCQWKAIIDHFAGGVSMSGLRGTFFLIYRPAMKTKTCRFGTILDLSTRPISRGCFLKFIFVAYKLFFKISYCIYFDYFSTFSSISCLTMETKMRRFGNILDSATRSNSCWGFFDINFCCGESPTL